MDLNDLIIRPATRNDCGQLLDLIKHLAEFEKMPNSVKITKETLEKDGFDCNPPAFFAYMLEDKSNPNESIGFSVCFISYDTFYGKRFFIEDIMVVPNYRGKGIGTKLFHFLCHEALRLKCEVINFYVLDWNPANKFYQKMGAIDCTKTAGWHWHIMYKEQIEAVAKMF